MNKTSDAKTKCPFFIRDSATKITCEGPGKTELAIGFKSKVRKRTYQKQNCYKYKCKCEIKKMMEEKYDNRPECDNG